MPPTISPYNPEHSSLLSTWFGLVPFSVAPTKGMYEIIFLKNYSIFFSFPPLTMMFRFSGFASVSSTDNPVCHRIRFSHSEICGSKVGSHLPAAYRRHPTSFIASISQGIHHLLLKLKYTLS